MSITRVAELRIERFRRFRNVSIPFGENVTLLAGQNATSKSTLLGMLAQPFSFGVVQGKTANNPDNSSYTSNYHGFVLKDYVDLTGKPFMYDCDDVFRLSKQYDTNSSTYEYRTVLVNVVASEDSPLVDNALFTRNRPRPTSKGVRFVTGPGPSHKLGEGNYPHPVIYLGLNRLWPLAQAKKCRFTEDTLSPEDRQWYVEKYNEILCLDEQENSAKFMNTAEKRRFVTPESVDYDGESCSAGQDNLGQLLTAILSFKHLKQKLGTRYKGGMLLIDELDASLHAFAQERLLALLCESSKKLGLQVVATTHSLHLLQKAFKSPLRQDTDVIHLSNLGGEISLDGYDSYEDICEHLKLEPTPALTKSPAKVSVVFEDRIAQYMFRQICGSKLSRYISVIYTTTFGSGDLKYIGGLATKLPELKGVILVADGDMANEWSKPPENLMTLPGGVRPETLAYRHLYELPDTSAFWGKPKAIYNRQYVIMSKGGTAPEIGADKKWVKNWYNGQQREFLGQYDARIFKSWVEFHKPECLVFFEAFLKLLRTRYKGEIPIAVIERTRDQLK